VARHRKVILLIESSRAAGRAMLKGIATYSHHHGPWSFFWKAAGFEQASSFTRALEADGAILRDVELPDELLAKGPPVVIVGHSRNEIEGVANVVTDSATIGRLGANHLLGCGFQHFAFCGYLNCSWSELREVSFSRQVAETGLSCATFNVRSQITGAPWKQERKYIAEWLRHLLKPVGLMACNDDLGQEVIEAGKLVGLSVPDDMAVLGADNDEIVCGLSDPPLSSVAINFERAGYEAAQVLDRLMNGAKRKTVRILVPATHVVPRRSTDIVAVEDENLAKALHFIRDHAAAGLSVTDVARAAGLSRRSLEQRFRTVLGHSVLQEIRRLRVDHIARLLVDTELSVAEIADSLGFTDVQHISRYFRKAKTLSPLRYRKTYGRKASSIRTESRKPTSANSD
jgi:LacI family transcriptional regulator